MSNNYLKSKWLSLRKNVLATLRLMIPWVLLPPKTFCQVCEMTKQNGRKKIHVINEQPPPPTIVKSNRPDNLAGVTENREKYTGNPSTGPKPIN